MVNPALQIVCCNADSNMEPYERAQATVNVSATRSGVLTVVACFYSKELAGVSGTMDVNVIAPERRRSIE